MQLGASRPEAQARLQGWFKVCHGRWGVRHMASGRLHLNCPVDYGFGRSGCGQLLHRSRKLQPGRLCHRQNNRRGSAAATREGGSGGRADLSGRAPVSRQLQEQVDDLLLSVRTNQKTFQRQIRQPIKRRRKIPLVASNCEIGHGRNITWTLQDEQSTECIREAWVGTSWIVESMTSVRLDDKTLGATQLFLIY